MIIIILKKKYPLLLLIHGQAVRVQRQVKLARNSNSVIAGHWQILELRELNGDVSWFPFC